MKALDFIPEAIKTRGTYLEKIKPYIGKEIIKVLTGQRRVGKSYLLYLIMNYILSEDKKANIVYINKEQTAFKHISTDMDLTAYISTKEQNQKNYLFIDEVQEIESFETALRSLLVEGKWDIWCTGSNASFLSGDITGKLSGRFIEIPVFSLSYSEFLDFNALENNEQSLDKYLRYGGLPFLRHLDLNDAQVFEYLKGIYATILFKDVINRFNIRNTHFLERLVLFAADNTGSLISGKKISDYLKSQQLNIPTNLVLEYLKHLSDAYMLRHIKRSDLQGKRFFEVGEKYYFNDLGLRNSITGYKPNDIGKVIENAVLLHLLKSGYKVFTGAEKDKEIDFVAFKTNQKLYVQVAYLIPDNKVFEREFGNLLLVKDNYPKYVVSHDRIKMDNYNGIEHLRLDEFLLKDI